jgi:hypothetical protein
VEEFEQILVPDEPLSQPNAVFLAEWLAVVLCLRSGNSLL